MANENDDARAKQEADLRKVGLDPAPHPKLEAGESDEDEEETEDVEKTDEEESEDESDETEDSEEESDEDEDEEDEDESDKDSSRKKTIPVKVHNELRTKLREAQAKLDAAIEDNKKLSAKLPDDFDDRVSALAKELNIQDPEGLKKIAKLVKEAATGKVSELEKKLSELEKTVLDSKKNAPIADEFPKEWKSFEKSFTKEFPNATAEQIERAQELMKTLSHTPNIGGKVYKDKDGREMLDPYELDYIFFKNREKFEEVVTEKKRKGMETTRTQKIGEDRGGGKKDAMTLPANPTTADLEAYSKASNKVISERDSLRVQTKLNV